MIPFQGICNLHLVAVNLQFGLYITSEKHMKAWLISDMRLANET